MEEINKVIVKQQPKLTGQIGNTLIYVDPDLEDKSIDITENGMYTITADEGYDALSTVEINANVEVPLVGYMSTACNNNGYATHIVVGGIKNIPNYAFTSEYNKVAALGSRYLEEVTMLEGVETIGSYAFLTHYGYNTALKKVNFPATLKSIGYKAFTECRNLTVTELPDGLETIDGYAFWFTNTPLTKLPSSLTSLGSGAFRESTLIAIKTIPDGVTSIGQETFYRCTALKQISMKNVKTIGSSGTSYQAFQYCSALKAVWIGSAINTNGAGIYRYSFEGCSNLSKIFIDLPRATVETFESYQYGFMNNTSKTGIIICNDDPGFMSKEEFDAIDWDTYTG